MNTQDTTPSQPPAAALLFQAPEFTAPVFQAPAAVENEPSTSAGTPRTRTRRTSSASAARSPGGNSDQGEAKESDQGSDQPAQAQRSKGNAQAQKQRNTAKSKAKTAASTASGADSEASEAPKDGQRDKATASGASDQTTTETAESSDADESSSGSARRRRRRPRSTSESDAATEPTGTDQVQGLKGSTRLEAKRMRRREGRRDSRRRQSITEAEFLARRESVDREMIVRHQDGSDQIAVLEDGILVEHFVARRTAQSIVGNIYLGRVQNVLPSMEAAFVDVGRGRNAVLYAGEVNWDVLGMEGKPRRIETALKAGDTVMVQVTKDPIGHKGARLTSQITLAGRYLVFVPGSSMLGISRKLPDNERARLKKVLQEIVPSEAGVIVRTAAEGATESQLRDDVERLVKQWESIEKKSASTRKAPILVRGEPELVVRVVRDLFNEDFSKLIVQGDGTWDTVREYVEELSPELTGRLEHWTSKSDVFAAKKVQQQLAKAMDRKVWLPSGGTLVIERTEALTVVDVNTGKFVGSGGTLEETVTRNNLEAAEEIVRQLRLRDIGGIIIIDFVDMVLESNRELVLRRLVECLGRDRTRHQVTEITSLGLVQMTRKRVGEGLVEAFSTSCDTCEGRGFIVHDHPVEIEGDGPSRSKQSDRGSSDSSGDSHGQRQQRSRGRDTSASSGSTDDSRRVESHVGDQKVRTALSAIAAATRTGGGEEDEDQTAPEGPAAGAHPAQPSAENSKARKNRGSKRQTQQPKAATAEPLAIEARGDRTEPTDMVVRTKSVSDITLPQRSSEPGASAAPSSTPSHRRSARGGSRRVVTRAAGSPPSASKPAETATDQGKHDSAREAVKSLFDEA